jgi:tRNA (mo5U34)-methyltransferase
MKSRIAENPLWYHTIEVAPGVETPGWFDLRPIVDKMPWPDVEGKRCLDVGTYDGFLAFELERRGAAEVMAVDLADHTQWDWSWEKRQLGPKVLAAMAGQDKAAGFHIAHELLESKVERREISVYELSPGEVGSFDVVVCGSLMLHLRDPVRALGAMRSVCDGVLLSAETIDPVLTLVRRAPAAHFRAGDAGQWWVPNPAGHRRMLEAAGFQVLSQTKPYAIPMGAGHPPRTKLRDRVSARLLSWTDGVPHSAALAAPRRSGS